MRKVAEIISFVLHPFLLTLLLILLGIEKSNLSQTSLMIFTIFALFFNCILPFYILFYSTKRGMVLDDVLDNKEVLKNRPFYLGWATVILFLETLLVYFLGKPQPLLAILIILSLLGLTLFLISRHRKISLHVAETTAFCLVALFVFDLSSWPILALIPLVFWSRFYLKRHTIRQMGVGFLAALVIVFLVLYYFKLLPSISIS